MRFDRHTPIGPWEKCVYEACVFDTFGEFRAAVAIDRTESVAWWLRNDPAVFVIPTPVGGFEPDFLYVREEHGARICGALEVKGDFLWTAPGQPDRVKANAAGEWVRKANAMAGDQQWEVAVVGDQEAKTALHLGELLAGASGYLYVGPD